jgi:membrane-associated phospholipid phosphatase
MPSLHLTTAILGTVYLPRAWKWVGVVFIALTACATITTGQHYLIDLVASVPFAAMIMKLVNWKPAASHRRAPQAA